MLKSVFFRALFIIGLLSAPTSGMEREDLQDTTLASSTVSFALREENLPTSLSATTVFDFQGYAQAYGQIPRSLSYLFFFLISLNLSERLDKPSSEDRKTSPLLRYQLFRKNLW